MCEPESTGDHYFDLYLQSLRRIGELEQRREELLALVAKLSQTVPLEPEVAESLNQRGTLLAEIGTLRSRIRELESTHIEHHPQSSTELLTWPKYDPPPDCKHNYLTATVLDGRIIGQNCNECWLPVGIPCDPEPANDIGMMAFVELEALEIACGYTTQYGEDTVRGAQAWEGLVDVPDDAGWGFWIGYLAAEIQSHDA